MSCSKNKSCGNKRKSNSIEDGDKHNYCKKLININYILYQRFKCSNM
jgi:hypothetical protein